MFWRQNDTDFFRGFYMRKALLTSAVLIALSGCGSTSKGTQEFNTANELANAQQFEEAIAYLQQAIAKNPDNKTYSAKLTQLKQQYLQNSLAKINALLQGETTKDNLDKAQQLVASLEKSGVNTQQLETIKAQINDSRTELYANLASLYADAKALMEQEKWVAAYDVLGQISSKFSNYEDVQLRLKTVESQAVKGYLKQANDAIKQDDFAAAKSYLNDLLKVIPNNPIAKSLLKRIGQNDNSGYFLAKAQIAYDQQQWENVIALCKRVAGYEIANPDCTEMLKQAKTKQAEQLSAAVLESMSEGRLLEAISLYQQLKNLNTMDANKLVKLRDGLSQQTYYSAGTYKQNGRYGVAWHLLKGISEINPAYPELFNDIRQVEDAIYDRSKRKIAVFDFNSPVDSNDAGVIVANNLISRLFNNASNDITILERENLKSILEEMKLGQIGVVSESTAKEMGRVYGIDFAIMGSVLLYKVDSNTAASTKTIRYQVGEKIQDNIDYLNWIAANPKPSRKELQSAPKAKIMVPEYGEKEYEVTQTKKVGFLQLSFRIVDVLTGENTRVDTIERKIEESDSSNAGVRDAGIEFDPMEVPTDTEILQTLTEEIVEHMAAEVLRPLQQLETFYFNQGKDRERRAELEAAVEFYTYAVFNEKLKSISSSPVTIEAQKHIDEILARFRFNLN